MLNKPIKDLALKWEGVDGIAIILLFLFYIAEAPKKIGERERQRQRPSNFQTDRKLIHVQSYPRFVESNKNPELNSCHEISCCQ